MFRKIIFFLFIVLGTLTSCQDSDPVKGGSGVSGEEVLLFMSMQVPSAVLPGQTRNSLPNERVVEDITILVLEKSGENFLYSYQVKGQSLTSGSENIFYFNARLVATESPVKLLLLANAAQDIAGVSVHTREQDIKAILTRDYPEVSTGMSGILPMSAELSFPSGITVDQQASVQLTRGVARVDVYNGVPADFILTSVQIFRAHQQISLFPGETGDITTPTLPSGSLPLVDTEAVATGNVATTPVYLPESAIVTDRQAQVREATCVVIGGIYKGDSTPSYYRMDFVPEGNPGLFGQVLRNHKYVFTIQGVRGRGWETPEEASRNTSTQMEAEIKEWDEHTINMSFDDTHHLAVSARELLLDAIVGDRKFLEVDTDLDSYTVYWLDSQGQETSATLYPGGRSILDEEGIFELTVSEDGTRIVCTTLQQNAGSEWRSKTIRLRAGRLSLTCDIRQGLISRSTRQLVVYGSNYELGSFGNQLLGSGNNSPSRPATMISKLRNTSNFGPNTELKFQGFAFAGTSSYEIPPTYVDMFDVIYLTYVGNPNPAPAIQWLNEKNNRVLIVQMEGSSTNKKIMTALGVTHFQSTKVTPFTLSEEAPPEILEGPFGSVSRDMKFRCYDTTHAEISLEEAARCNITPILIGGGGGVALGVDLERKIVYSGDIDMYSEHKANMTDGAVCLSSGSTINKSNSADVLICNLWAWIATVALSQE